MNELTFCIRLYLSQSLGINFTDEDIEEIINELDVNSMGDINYR